MTFTPKKIYLLVATLVGLFGSLIAAGALAHSVLEFVLLTDEEFLATEQRRVDQCEQPMWKNETHVSRSDEEIQDCVARASERLAISRRAEFKEDLAANAVALVLLLILLGTHGPAFRKITRDEK